MSTSSTDPAPAPAGSALDEQAPPWTYNPSAWRERIPIGLLAGVAAILAAYMALYQWRLIGGVWDPVFGDQTRQVLDSAVSERMRRWFLVPDAALGALAYLGDAIYCLAGSTRRWQYRPWMTLLFGLDVIPLGIVSAVLVVLQGAVVGAWCFLCLLTAAISLVLVYLAYDEVWSTLVYLRNFWRTTRSRTAFWNVFWGRRPAGAAAVAGSAHGLMWPRIVELMVGVWLLLSPFVFRHDARELALWWVDLASGSAVIACSLVSFWSPLRRAHFATLGVALSLIAAAFAEGGGSSTSAQQNHVMVGLVLAMFAIVPSQTNLPPHSWREARAHARG
jgi:hypothetical protein